MSERKITGYGFRDDIDAVHNALVEIHDLLAQSGITEAELEEGMNLFLAGLHERNPELAWPIYERTLH